MLRNSGGEDYALFLPNKNFNLHSESSPSTNDECVHLNSWGLWFDHLILLGLRQSLTIGERIQCCMLSTVCCIMLGMKTLERTSDRFAFYFRTAISDTKGQYSRIYETFWFAHGQFLKRWQAWCEQCSWSLCVKVLNRARSTSNAFCGSSWFGEAKRRPWAWLHCGILWVWFQSWKQVEHIIGLFMFF